MTTTKIIYGSNWIKASPDHPGYDIVTGQRVTISQPCTYDGTNSYVVLSNGFKPYFYGNGVCSVTFEYSDKYDCINGDCLPSTQYSTPGIYQSVDDCNKVCGTGGVCGNGKICIDPNNYCPDGKACLDQSEVSQINSLLSKVKGDVC